MKKAIFISASILIAVALTTFLLIVERPQHMKLKSGNKIPLKYVRAELPISLPREAEQWFDKKTISNHVNTESLNEDRDELLAMRKMLYLNMNIKVLVLWDKGIQPYKYELFENAKGAIEFKNVQYWVD